MNMLSPFIHVVDGVPDLRVTNINSDQLLRLRWEIDDTGFFNQTPNFPVENSLTRNFLKEEVHLTKF